LVVGQVSVLRAVVMSVFLRENLEMARSRVSAISKSSPWPRVRKRLIMLWLDVEVRMRVLSVLRNAPRGSPYSVNFCRKNSTSWRGTSMLVSSTYARVMFTPPFLSSSVSLNRRLVLARCSRSIFILERMWSRTIAAKMGERGQPCAKPSLTGMWNQVPSSLLTQVLPKSSYRRSAKFSSSGNEFEITSRSFCLETALNMFLMSKDISAREGRMFLSLADSGSDMYFSTPSRMVEVMMSMPPLTPMAKLVGSIWRAKVLRYFDIMPIAVMRLMADGIPRGRSLEISVSSFWRATRYVVRRRSLILSPTAAFAIIVKNFASILAMG